MGLENAKVISVNISRKTGQKKNGVDSVCAIAEKGLEDDAHAVGGDRQISLLATESIQRMIKEGAQVGPGDFAENITTEGVDLLKLPIGCRLKVGEAIIEVTRHGKECPAPCAIYYQVGYCVMPTDGIFARIIEGGLIKPNDPIRLVEKSQCTGPE